MIRVVMAALITLASVGCQADTVDRGSRADGSSREIPQNHASVSITGERSLRYDGVEGRFIALRIQAGEEEITLRGNSAEAGLVLSRPSFYLQLKVGPSSDWVAETADAGVYQVGPDARLIKPGERADFLAALRYDSIEALEAGGQVRICLSEEMSGLCSAAYSSR